MSDLADPTRARILRLLAREELSVGELAHILEQAQSTVSRHLKVLRAGGWVRRRSVGTASLLRRVDPLPATARDLWAVVAAQIEPLYAGDVARMETVVALRRQAPGDFFERIAGRWDAVRRELFGESFVERALLSLIAPALTIGDLGCGTGGVIERLAPIAGRVIGVDREQVMLDAARSRTAGLANVELRQGGLEALPIEAGELDLALCMLVLHHVEALSVVFGEIARVLRPGGRLVVADMVRHDREAYRETMGHRHLGFDREGLKRLGGPVGLELLSYEALPAAPSALGPPIFVAALRLDG